MNKCLADVNSKNLICVSKLLKSKIRLILFQWQHKGQRARPFKCQQCNKSYLRKSLLDAHTRSHRGKRLDPSRCSDRTFISGGIDGRYLEVSSRVEGPNKMKQAFTPI